MQPPPFHDDEPPPSSIDPNERAKMLLSQRLLEAQLEIVRTAGYQKRSRQGRRVWFLVLFGVSGFVAYILNQRDVGLGVAIGAPLLTLLLIAIVWAYQKPY